MNAPRTNPTEDSYRELIEAYDFFNRELFDNQLPGAIITVTRRRHTAGYYSFGRFGVRDPRKSKSRYDEIALNPTHFGTRPIEYVLSTLAHEMVHQWQYHFGVRPRAGYHDTKWGDKMIEIGLMPSSTGRPGGRKTGDVMSDYPIEGGRFVEKCVELITLEYRLSWYDRHTTDRVEQPSPDSPVRKLLSARLGGRAPMPMEVAAKPAVGLAVTLDDVPMTIGPVIALEDGESPEPQAAPIIASPQIRPIPQERGDEEDVVSVQFFGGTPTEDDFIRPKDQTSLGLVANSHRVKYTCCCKHNVWGKPGLKIQCNDCMSMFSPNPYSRRDRARDMD